jgi:protein-tyrosine kinase
MSRIHDALKKAERERIAVQGPGATTPVSVPLPSEPMQSERLPVTLASEGGTAMDTAFPSAVGGVDFLRFDDLIATCSHPQWQLDPNVNVFSNPGLSAHGAEQFRTLRSRLYQLRNDQPIRTILITSTGPGEGKTFVASNLAQAIVRQPSRRALLIDADLRCARLHVPFRAPASPGLSDYLRGGADEAAVIQCGQNSNLCLIPGGDDVTNPSELLSNGRLSTLLNRVAPVFDWIILDSPPCLPVADASILAELCDAILFVVRAGVTPSEAAQRALQELQGRNVAGVVLNAVEENDAYGGYYRQGYGYGVADAEHA